MILYRLFSRGRKSDSLLKFTVSCAKGRGAPLEAVEPQDEAGLQLFVLVEHVHRLAPMGLCLREDGFERLKVAGAAWQRARCRSADLCGQGQHLKDTVAISN